MRVVLPRMPIAMSKPSKARVRKYWSIGPLNFPIDKQFYIQMLSIELSHCLRIFIINTKINYLNKQMQQRLMAENNIRCPFEGNPYFCITSQYLAYRLRTSIKIRPFIKNAKEIDLELQNQEVRNFALCQHSSSTYLIILYHNSLIQIHSLSRQKQKIQTQLIFQQNDIKLFEKHSTGLIFITNDGYLRILQMLQIHAISKHHIKTVDQCGNDTKIISHEGNTILILDAGGKAKQYVQYEYQKQKNQFNKTAVLQYISEPFAFYQDRYLFQSARSDEIQIYDIEWEKIIGRFQCKGKILHTQLKHNLLMMIADHQNLDRYLFFALNPNLQAQSDSLITNRSQYERGKGSYFSFLNFTKEDAKALISGKNEIFQHKIVPEIGENTESIIYMVPKNKDKIQMLKVSHLKILQSQFVQEKIERIIPSKLKEKKVDKNGGSTEIEKQRIKASIQKNKGHKSGEQIHKAFIEFLIQTKIKGVLDKFNELEHRIIGLEQKIDKIYTRIDESLKNIQKQEIKKNVEHLFQQVTPQFEDYFSEMFKQISGVMDQGVTYYNNRLAKQAELHKDAMVQLVNMTFDASQEVMELGREELKYSQKTNNSVNRLLQMRKQWENQRKENFNNFRTQMLSNQLNERNKLKGFSNIASNSMRHPKPQISEQ